MIETHELVVPKSIPITSPASVDFQRRFISNNPDEVAEDAVGVVINDLLANRDADRRNNVELADNIVVVVLTVVVVVLLCCLLSSILLLLFFLSVYLIFFNSFWKRDFVLRK